MRKARTLIQTGLGLFKNTPSEAEVAKIMKMKLVVDDRFQLSRITDGLLNEAEQIGYDELEVQLEKEQTVLEHVTEQLAELHELTQALLVEKVLQRKNEGYEVAGALQHFHVHRDQANISVEKKQALQQIHDALKVRQIAYNDLKQIDQSTPVANHH